MGRHCDNGSTGTGNADQQASGGTESESVYLHRVDRYKRDSTGGREGNFL